jgi:AraC-like DNA-binding protein
LDIRVGAGHHGAVDRDLEDRRGVLRPPPPDTWWLDRRAPGPVLAPYLAWYWSVRWDLRGRPPHRQATLPHPSSQLVVEEGRAVLHGPPTRLFERVLSGVGRVVGVRFTAGGLAALLGRPLRGGPAPASLLPGLDADALGVQVTAAPGLGEAAEVLDRTLSALVPAEVPAATELVERAVQVAQRDRSVRGVPDLAARVGLGVRALQRLFAEHVGLSPGWVIRRCRLQEAALAATEGERVDWAGLAADLGYCDQAHLVRDFTRVIGVPPARYART